MYTSKDIEKILGISKQRLAYWRSKKLITPSAGRSDGRGRGYLYSYQDLRSLRDILKLQENKVSTYRIRIILERLRNDFPELKEPRLLTTPITFKEKKIFVTHEGVTYDAEDGQCLLIPLEQEETTIYEFIPTKPSRDRQLEKLASNLKDSLKKQRGY